MRKSKLELYEEVLSLLVDRSLSVENIAFLCEADCATVEDLLEFLEKNKLVENNHSYIKVLYSLTERGEAVYESLTKPKRLNKVQRSIQKIKQTENKPLPLAE